MKTNFDAYLRYDELTQALHALAEEHPRFCKVESIGKSYEGREIWLAELTNAETGPAETKPAFWVDGNTHAGEVTGSMAALYLIEHLLEKHGSEDLPTRLLDEQAFYVLPRLSPDGAERYLTTASILRMSTATATSSRCASRNLGASGASPTRTLGSWFPGPPTRSTPTLHTT